VPVLTFCTVFVTLNLKPQRASGLFSRSVILPVCKVKVYLPPANELIGFIVKILPLIDFVIGMDVPPLFLSSIQRLPALIGSLKVTLITLLTGTLTALFAGSILMTIGGAAVLIV